MRRRPRFKIIKKVDILNITPENDMRYRGPLSYRYLRILAWLGFLFLQILNIIRLRNYIEGEIVVSNTVMLLLELFGILSVPLLLIANFAVILNGTQSYRKLIITYSFMALIFGIVFLYVYYHFFARLVSVTSNSPGFAQTLIKKRLDILTQSNSLMTFNFFIDLLICTLILFFINYDPKKFFQGKKRIIFRLFVLLPVLYEIGCVAIKVLVSELHISVPVWCFPLLTTKPPFTFVIFLIAALYIKKRESYFIKHGKTHEDYQKFLKTNTNSFQFSISLSAIIILVSIADFASFIIIGMAYRSATGLPPELAYLNVASWGFGGSAKPLLIVPLLLLFSYTKTHKNILIDLMIPVAAIIMVSLTYVEGAFQLLCSILKGV